MGNSDIPFTLEANKEGISAKIFFKLKNKTVIFICI